MRPIDMTGDKYGKLKVLGFAHANPRSWLCECECGVQKVVRGDHLRGGLTQSCGCLQAEARERRTENEIAIDGDIAKIKLGGAKGGVAIIDAQDVEKVRGWRWGVFNGYAGGKRGRREFIYLHRFILGTDAPSVDHWDGDPMNNRRSNLRPTTQRGNGANRRSLNKNNTSGYRGVVFSKEKRRWVAQIKVNYKTKRLGYFDSPQEAARAYDEAAKQYHGQFATLNEV